MSDTDRKDVARTTDVAEPWTQDEFERKLREKEKFYHINHEFHVLMNAGKLDKQAIQGWVANRFYYQVAIPVKDAAIMSNCWQRDVRRQWVLRILDHDGTEGRRGRYRSVATAWHGRRAHPGRALVAATSAAWREVRH